MGSLRFRISFIVSLVVAIILFLFGLLDVIQTRRRLRHELASELEMTVNRLATELWSPVYDYNRDQVKKFVTMEMQIPYVKAVIVRDAYDKKYIGGLVRDKGSLREVTHDDRITSDFHMQAPIVRVNESLGTVDVHFSDEHVSTRLRTLVQELVLQLVSLLVVVTVTLSLVLSKTILTPLIDMRNTFRAVADGDFDQVVDTSRTDAIGELATSFASLQGSVKNTIEELSAEICERKRVQRDLQEIFDASSDAIFIHDAETGAVLDVNRAMCDMYHCTREEASSCDPNRLLADVEPYTAVEAQEWLEKAKEEGPQMFEWRARKMTGEVFWCEVGLRSCEIGGRPRILAVVRDISSRKDAELRLRDKEEQLRQAQKMDSIGQLAGGVAHDFNNMLAGILSSAQILRRRLDDEPKLLRFVNMIEESSLKAADLTQQLLTFSRKAMIKTVPVDIHALVRDTIELLERTIDRRIELRSHLVSRRAVVLGDPSQLQNALLNLGVNARDAMPEGGELVYSSEFVHLDENYCAKRSIEPGAYVLLRVRDTGVGIPIPVQKRIFEPFFTTKDLGKGTGLGLSAVYGTITEHKGEIHVYSEENRGTEFRIYLPLSVDDAAAQSLIGNEIMQGKGHILLIDDEEVVREVGQESLSDFGYTVTLAKDGEEGVAAYGQGQFDLVLLDLTMPKMSGHEVFAKLKEINPEIKVVFCSGFSREQSVNELLEAGASGFVKKPFRQSELSQAIAEALAQ